MTGTAGRTVRGRTGVAWTVILLCVAFLAGRAFLQKRDASSAAADTVLDIDFSSRMILGEQARGATSPEQLRAQLDQLDHGSAARRLRLVVVSAEIDGPAEARRRLDAIRTSGAGGADTERLSEILAKLYAEPDDGLAARAAALGDDERALLTARLGWLGTLAAAPRGSPAVQRSAALAPARGAAFALGGFACVLLTLGLATLAALVALVVRWSRGTLALRFGVPTATSGVLVETCALYLLLMTAPGLIAGLPPGLSIPVGAATMVVAALSIAWPRVRGVPWPETRRALGLHAGTGLLREAGCGVVAYCAGLPVLCVGIAATAVLSVAAKRLGLPTDATHPIVPVLAGAGPAGYGATLLLASVAAPLLEETFFRGALYGHLRSATSGASRALSVAGSAGLSGLLFAAVHPQSWIAVPALAAFGVVLALAREWRGSLIAPMVAHGLSNGLALTAVWLLLS